MGWSNYIVDKTNHIMYEVSRNVSVEDFEDFCRVFDIIVNQYKELEGHDIIHSESQHLNTFERSFIMNMGFNVYGMMVMSMESYYFLDFMLMLWLKKHDFDFEFLSEFEVDERKSEFESYKKVMRG